MSRTRLIAVLALVVGTALATSVPTALAQQMSDDGDRDDDTMGAASCVLSPNQVSGQAADDEDGVNAFQNDAGSGDSWDPLEFFDTDPGHFTFGGQAECAGLDLADEDDQTGDGDGSGAKDNGGPLGPEPVGPVLVDIQASGDYDNWFCGTGTANGTALVTEAEGTTDIQIHTHFGITFVGGTGALSIVVQSDETGTEPYEGQWDSTPGTQSWVGQNNIDGGNGAGVINISVTGDPDDGDCDASNVTHFNVNGAFATSLSGEGDDDGDTAPEGGVDDGEGGDSDL